MSFQTIVSYQVVMANYLERPTLLRAKNAMALEYRATFDTELAQTSLERSIRPTNTYVGMV